MDGGCGIELMANRYAYDETGMLWDYMCHPNVMHSMDIDSNLTQIVAAQIRGGLLGMFIVSSVK